MKRIIYDYEKDTDLALADLQRLGIEFEAICPVCGSKLRVAMTREKAYELDMHPGIECPNSLDHVLLLVSFCNKDPALIDRNWVERPPDKKKRERDG